MRLPFELLIALRHLRSRKRERFISAATFICILGITLGVMALIVVLSVMNGFQEVIKERILSLSAHVLVTSREGTISDYPQLMKRLKEIRGIQSVYPMIAAQVMIGSKDALSGAVLRGITDDSPYVLYLRERGLMGSRDLKAGQVWVGTELARLLNLKLGDQVRVFSPYGLLHPFGMIPRVRSFEVTGIFQSGIYDYDISLALVPLEDAQHFLSLEGAVTHLEVRVQDIYQAHEISQKVQFLLGPRYVSRDWMQMNRNLFYALRMERRIMFLLLSLTVAIASFNIIGVLMMTVMERRREIAILRSMGAKRASVAKVFLYEGLLIGVIGTAFGTVAGLALAFNVEPVSKALEALLGFKFLPPDVYYITEVPSKVNPWDVLTIIGLALALSLASALYPALKASKLDPVEVLRYE